MKHPALLELRDLVNVPDHELRSQLLEHWFDRWTIPLEFTQAVVNTDVLESEHADLVKIHLARSLAEDLAEDCVSYEMRPKRVTASMVGIRRRAK